MKNALAHATIALARRALPLMSKERREEATRIINHFERDADDELRAFGRHAAAAWESDMRPVRDALVAALQTGDLAALGEFRRRCPDLLEQINEQPALGAVLHRQLLRVFAASLGEATPPPEEETEAGQGKAINAAVDQWRSRVVFPTEFGSADLRGLSSELHLRSIFSARTTNADYLAEVAKVVDQILSGEINMATGRWLLVKKLKQLGYDPERGFPQDMANVPPAERGSLQDLSSQQRIDLMLRTNVEMTRNYARVVEGNSPAALRMWPAWRLKRVASRVTPRGERRDREGELVEDAKNSWEARWQAAGDSVGWEGALKSVMVARKDSPIWQALGDGAGGYTDTLGHPFGPFAFNSGFDQVAEPKASWLQLLAAEQGNGSAAPEAESGPMRAQLAPTAAEVQARLAGLSPDLRARLLAKLAA